MNKTEKQPLLNAYVNNVTMSEALQEICTLVETKTKSYIVAVNVDVVMKMEKDDYLRKITNEADLTLVDGKPLIWFAKWHKCPVKAKISGSDLVPELCRVAAEKGYRVFIIGGAEGVADKAKENLERNLVGIQIVGTYAPPFGFEKDKDEIQRINAIISDSHPDLLIVCFGCPKQEKWIYENYQFYKGTVSICAGATVDFLAGNVDRAPVWMSEHGLEWLFRFLQEPKRLFKRYFVDDIKILGLVWKYRRMNRK